ncbi:hypothetical protein Kpol_1072p46 [Vanderwaltozyma polyspora DSM 70294]|uniref:WD repeat-containing protein 75 second beta-propeller domain-containing protein n=1 Tax=Vanderwaltozyma polyspora (strain ATCC 22028 / DSM 70294 / BCRC 21397 / CBS 2163 / NBRC 10782 / NRRL Y-8283 / UCD 57-17) TaxID=436907 RepID=A7TKR4_VANPO|nr:uncharacterized protein Kpol_1072p46 [Vanderwaltozyma polyspora DSM 70294]EDO17176.1 hypothetical protein Kpol_1072p46 [Vanderwaltozyma polyspora DSM 70294]
MTQSSAVNQQYKLSVVSGGKPILPRYANSSSLNKSVTCLTHDLLNYIVPFNNQLKIYSIETRQCIKTIKFANSDLLMSIFSDDDTFVTDIKLGNIVDTSNGNAIDVNDKDITIFTNHGYIVVLQYKGKLLENPLNFKLDLNDGEFVSKIFQDEETGATKVLTTKQSDIKSSLFTYNLYSLSFNDNKLQSKLDRSFENTILSTWSTNDKFLALLHESEGKKQLSIASVFDVLEEVKSFPVSSILSATTSTGSANSRYVTSMAIDNTNSQLALGFASGVITIVDVSDLKTRLLKWHIDSVLSLAFTKDGSYLLSGGWEKVVIFWQLSTNLQQFLPRLNGVMIDCQSIGNDKYYSLALQMSENRSNSDFQLLLLNAADLKSSLSINGPLPVFNSTIKDSVQLLSAVSTRTSTNISKASMSKKKQKKKLLKSKRQDYTTCIEIHPTSKHLVFPHMSAIQTYDFYRNEQIAYQYLTSGINNSMGKVRFELNIRDPEVVDVKFTKNGKWMITSEIEYPPADLLSSKDLIYHLKFWYKNDQDSDWALKTKVINPHGLNVPITKIISCPYSVNNSEGCITADNNGGLKYWSYEDHEKNWCLTKISLPNFNHFSNSVSLDWSQDGSLVFHGFDDKLTILDFDTFRKFETSDNDKIPNEYTLDTEIQTIKLVNSSNIIIATQTTLCSLNLLMGKIINSFDIYPFVKGIYKNGHLDRLISCDEKSGKIAIVINRQVKDESGNPTLKHKAQIIAFNSDLSNRLGTFVHNEYVSWIGWNHDTDFIFLDTESRLGIVGTTVNTEMLDEVNTTSVFEGSTNRDTFASELKKLSDSKSTNDDEMEDINLEFINGNTNDKTINMNSFTSMFENVQNVQMYTLFDRVMKVIT